MMKRLFLLWIISPIICNEITLDEVPSFKDFVIVIASYNNEQYARGNIRSAVTQDYPEEHYRIIYIDDCSTDSTYTKALFTFQQYNKGNVMLIHNEKRMGAMFNHWYVINHLIQDHEIVVILDGDDRLAGNGVLQYLNEVYSSGDIWLTYGQYREINSKRLGFNKPMPAAIVRRNAFRRYQDIPSHLRTFYAELYKKIKLQDLMLDGEFFSMCADMATAIPMIEMARDHFKFIDKVLYFYNDKNPISDHRVSKETQQEIDHYVRSLPVYEPLEKLF